MLCLCHSRTHLSSHKVSTCTFASCLQGKVTSHFHLKGNCCFNNTVYPSQYNIIKSYLYLMLIYIFAHLILFRLHLHELIYLQKGYSSEPPSFYLLQHYDVTHSLQGPLIHWMTFQTSSISSYDDTAPFSHQHPPMMFLSWHGSTVVTNNWTRTSIDLYKCSKYIIVTVKPMQHYLHLLGQLNPLLMKYEEISSAYSRLFFFKISHFILQIKVNEITIGL